VVICAILGNIAQHLTEKVAIRPIFDAFVSISLAIIASNVRLEHALMGGPKARNVF